MMSSQKQLTKVTLLDTRILVSTTSDENFTESSERNESSEENDSDNSSEESEENSKEVEEPSDANCNANNQVSIRNILSAIKLPYFEHPKSITIIAFTMLF